MLAPGKHDIAKFAALCSTLGMTSLFFCHCEGGFAARAAGGIELTIAVCLRRILKWVADFRHTPNLPYSRQAHAAAAASGVVRTRTRCDFLRGGILKGGALLARRMYRKAHPPQTLAPPLSRFFGDFLAGQESYPPEAFPHELRIYNRPGLCYTDQKKEAIPCPSTTPM